MKMVWYMNSLCLLEYKKRVGWIDVARAVSMLVIVYAHTYDNAIIGRFVHLFHVPVFFFLSGLVWRRNNLKYQIVGYFKGLLSPYYIVAIISITLYLAMGRVINGNSDTLTLTQCLKGLIYANSRTGLMAWNRPLWFLPCLFSVRFIWELIDYFVSDERNKCYTIGCFVFLGIILSYYFSDLKLPYELEISFIMLGFYYIGCKSKTLLKRFSQAPKILQGFTSLLCLIICLTIFNFNKYISVQNSTYGNFILFFLGAITGIIMILSISMMIENMILLQFVGQNTLSVLLWHKFPIIIFQLLPIGKICMKNPDSFSSTIIGMIVVIIVTALCMAFAFVIRLGNDCITKKENNIH